MVSLGRIGHVGVFAVVPGEFAGFNDDAAHGGAVAADEFGGGVDNDVGAVFDGAAEVGRGKGVVND